MRILSLIMIMIFAASILKGQGLAVNTDGSAAHISAILDVKSSDKGVLIPRLTNAQKLAIPFFNLTQGLLVYDIDLESFSFFNGYQWRTLNNSVGPNLWQQNGTHIYNSNSGNVGIGTFFPAGKLHVADESVFFTAPVSALSNTTNIGVTGEGLRTVWFPARAAFRAGGVTGVNATFWDRDSIGDYSAAFGLNVKAKGYASFAQGNFAQANGDNSFATGTIIRANGASSVCMGLQSTANGTASVAIGTGATTYGDFCFSAGFATRSYANYSTSIGVGSEAFSFGETSLGLYNSSYTPSSATSWVATDRVLSVGNGSGFGSQSTALCILKNGNTGIGITNPAYPLDVTSRIRIRYGGGQSAGIYLNESTNTFIRSFVGMETDATMGFYGYSGAGWGFIMNTTTGNIGIGNTNPNAPLQFSNTIANRKIVLYDANNNDHQYYGFGINGGTLRYQVDFTGADHVFFAGVNNVSSVELMRIKGNGNVGIGNNNPLRPLSFPAAIGKKVSLYPGATGDAGFGVWGNELRIHSDYNNADITFGYDNYSTGFTENVRMKANGNVGIGTNNPTQRLHVIGNILASGTITPSDLRFKNNIQSIQSPLSKLLLLNGVTYFMNRSAYPGWNFDSTLQYGVIAQEVEKLFPEMVTSIDDKGYKGVNYIKLIPVLIESVKEMNSKMEEAKKENKELKLQMELLLERINTLEKKIR